MNQLSLSKENLELLLDWFECTTSERTVDLEDYLLVKFIYAALGENPPRWLEDQIQNQDKYSEILKCPGEYWQ